MSGQGHPICAVLLRDGPEQQQCGKVRALGCDATLLNFICSCTAVCGVERLHSMLAAHLLLRSIGTSFCAYSRPPVFPLTLYLRMLTHSSDHLRCPNDQCMLPWPVTHATIGPR